jgi:hypothetical protein
MAVVFGVFLIIAAADEQPEPFLLDLEKVHGDFEDLRPLDSASDASPRPDPSTSASQSGRPTGLIILIVIFVIVLVGASVVTLWCLCANRGRERVNSEESWHDPLKYTIDSELIDA